MTKDTRLFFECTFGKKSHMNLAGKIILSPFILIIGGGMGRFRFFIYKIT